MSKIIHFGLATVLFLAPVLVWAQSAPNTAVPELTRSLSLGMQGSDVKSLQEFLARDSQIYPEGLATGYFGSKTQAAVKRWQQKYGIEAVGIVGPKTIAKIKEIGQAVTKESVQPTSAIPEAASATTATSPADTTPPTATLEVRTPAPTNVYIKLAPSEEVVAVYEYGLTINYGSVKEVLNEYSSSTTAVYLENLVPSTTYQVRAKVTDRSGNVGYSQNYSFTTPGVDDAPKISYGPNIVPSTAMPAVAVAVSWGTNIPCTGILYYGATGAFGNSQNSGYNTDHSVVITGLGSGATYVAKINCYTKDKALDVDEKNNFLFTATSTTNATSLISNPFLANVLKILDGIIGKFRIR